VLKRIHNISKIYTWDTDSNSLNILEGKDIIIKEGIIQDIIDKNSKNCQVNFDAQNTIVTPGFIDSHAHPIFFGNRSKEYISKLSGVSYAQIKESGGGIISSIKKTRSASFEELFEYSYKENIIPFTKYGTTTLECKSGYGLSLNDEIKSLEIVKKIKDIIDIDIFPTFLGAHAIPPEYQNNKSKYIDLICNEMIPEIADKKLAVFCDVFCEPGYFNIDETKKILNVAKKYNLIPRIHADEFIYSGGAELAAEINAISADHLMSVNDEAIESLSKSNTIATILPGTTFFLGNDNYANGRKMIDKGCKVSLASDFNPGTCTIRSLPNIMHLGMQRCGLSLDEAFLGVTYNAARAMGINKNVGLIKKDYNADLILWGLEDLSEIPYWFDSSSTKIAKIFKKGEIILG